MAKTYIILSNTYEGQPPDEAMGAHIRYADALVEHFVERFTCPGGVVFDPFAGFGTTVRVAERLSRVGYGLEFNRLRYEYARNRVTRAANLVHGDARILAGYGFPPFDLSITSPPYMRRGDGENPFTDYAEPGGGYDQYLDDLQRIYSQVARLMKPDARVVVEVANLASDGVVTPLAWDVATCLSRVLRFEGETVIGWEPTYGYGYDHSYALVFSRMPTL